MPPSPNPPPPSVRPFVPPTPHTHTPPPADVTRASLGAPRARGGKRGRGRRRPSLPPYREWNAGAGPPRPQPGHLCWESRQGGGNRASRPENTVTAEAAALGGGKAGAGTPPAPRPLEGPQGGRPPFAGAPRESGAAAEESRRAGRGCHTGEEARAPASEAGCEGPASPRFSPPVGREPPQAREVPA